MSKAPKGNVVIERKHGILREAIRLRVVPTHSAPGYKPVTIAMPGIGVL